MEMTRAFRSSSDDADATFSSVHSLFFDVDDEGDEESFMNPLTSFFDGGEVTLATLSSTASSVDEDVTTPSDMVT